VIRDGCPVSVLSKNIVVGDVAVLQTGGKVPADIRAVTSHNLRVDKSLLTGEAEPCKVLYLVLCLRTTIYTHILHFISTVIQRDVRASQKVYSSPLFACYSFVDAVESPALLCHC
jgi:P-type E1-E2 ATPase